MKTSLRLLVPIGVAAILFLPLTANCQTAANSSKEEFTPKYDLAGHWVEDTDPTPSTITRTGKHIVGTYNNALYEHTFEGDYVSPTTVEGVCTRKKISDQTTTTTHCTWVFSSPNVLRLYWVALDSKSDLKMGQSGYANNRRVSDTQPLAPPAEPLATQPPVTPPPIAKTPPLLAPSEPPAAKPVDPTANID